MKRIVSFFICFIVLISVMSTVPVYATGDENCLPLNDALIKESWGVKYSCDNGTYHISGTPKKSSFLNLSGGVDSIPEYLHEGDRLKIKFQSGTAYVTLGIRAFNEEHPDGIWLMKTSVDTEFVVPDLSEYTGISIRILVSQCNRNFDLKITPIIEKENQTDEVGDNIIPLNNGLTKNSSGVKYSCDNGTYHISGTPKKSSFLNLYGGVDSIPEELHAGERLKIQFQSGTPYVTLGIRAFNDEYLDGIWLMKTSVDTEFVVPDLSEYTGISIRILVSQCNRNFDLKVTPIIEKENQADEIVDNIIPLNNGLTKNSWGVQYSCDNGTYHISGTPKKSSFLNLYGGADSIPEELHAGERLKIQFQSGTPYVTLGIRAFNDEYPDGIWLMKTSVDTEFVVPDLSNYTGVSIRILVTACNREFDMKLTPIIRKVEKQKSYLTIIDDDGDIHYLTDLFPLIQELKVPISSAVTTKRIGSAKRWMDWDDITYLNNNGCEILNHTYNHYTGTEIKSIDDATIYSNYQKAREELLKRNISGGDFLVYSSSTGNDERVQNIASQIFKCGIKIGGSTINTADSNVFALSRYRIDYASTEGREDWNLDDMKSYVEEVASKGGWQIWMIHTSNAIWRQRVCLDEYDNVVYQNGSPLLMVDENGKPVLDNDGTYPTWGNTVLISMLKEAILYAQEMGVEIVSVEDAYNAIYK